MRKAALLALSLLVLLGFWLLTGCGTELPGGSGSLVLMTAALPSGTTGISYGVAISAQGGVAPYAFSVSGGALPGGFALSTAGVLTGTAEQTGTSEFTVAVADSIGEKTSRSYSLTVTATSAGNSLSITPVVLPGGTAGTPYSTSLTASGGTAPYVFAVTGGSVPAGLNFTAAGVLAGTPTTAGTFSFSVKVADAKGLTGSQTYSVGIAGAAPAAPLTITTSSLSNGTAGASYNASLAASGGTAPYVYTITSGSLPAGLTLSGTGTISGIPTTATGYSFMVTVADATGLTANHSYSVTIAAPGAALSIATASLPSGMVHAAYSAAINVAGGTAPYSFVTATGSLPAGLTLSSAGLLSGTPTAAGTFSFSVLVTDAKGQTANQPYSVSIAAAASTLSFTTTALPAGVVSTAYTSAIAATGGASPYSYTVTSGSVPAGVQLSAAGALTGTPTAANTYSFVVTATDAKGATVSSIFSVEIDPSASATLLLTTTTPPNAVVNTAYTYTLSVSNGTAPYTFATQTGNLPTGVTLSTAGLLSGTPTVTGSFPVTVSFTDSNSPKNSGTGSFTLVVTGATATVNVDMTTSLATVPANLFGLHTSVYDTNLADTSALPSLLANTGITTLRYPGGGYSDSYHWAQYAITPFYSTATGACGVVSNGYLAAGADFGHFAQLLQAAGTSGLVTINYGSSVADAYGSVTTGSDGRDTCSQPNTAGQPQEAAAWVAYANGDAANTQLIGKDAVGFDWRTVGFWASLRGSSPLSVDDGFNFLRIAHPAALGVKFWEIGNEMYYNGWATNHNAESDNHAPYIYPNGYSGSTFNSRASLPALSPTAYGTNAVAFIQAMKAVDATIKIGVDFSSPISTDPIPATWNPDLAQAVCAGASIDFAIMHYYPGTWKAVQPGELLSLPQTDIPNVAANIRAALAQYCPANASSIQIWLTETSPNNGLAPNFPQPVIGLFTLNDFLTALDTGLQNIDWLEMHDGSFLTENEVPGPSYYGILLAHQLAAVGDTAVKTTSSTTTIVSYATQKTNGQKGVLLINANASSPVAVQVTVAGATLGKTATQYSFGVNTTQSGTALTGTSFAIPGNTFSVTVPAYTAVELIIP